MVESIDCNVPIILGFGMVASVVANDPNQFKCWCEVSLRPLGNFGCVWYLGGWNVHLVVLLKHVVAPIAISAVIEGVDQFFHGDWALAPAAGCFEQWRDAFVVNVKLFWRQPVRAMVRRDFSSDSDCRLVEQFAATDLIVNDF